MLPSAPSQSTHVVKQKVGVKKKGFLIEVSREQIFQTNFFRLYLLIAITEER